MTYLIIGHAKCNASTVRLVTNRCLRKKEKNKILSVIYRHFDTTRLKRIGHYLLSLSLIVRDVIHGEKMRQMVSGREKWARKKKWTQIKCINWDSFVLRMECCLAIRFGQSTPKMDSSQQNFLFFFCSKMKMASSLWDGIDRDWKKWTLSIRNSCCYLSETSVLSVSSNPNGFRYFWGAAASIRFQSKTAAAAQLPDFK